MCYRLFLAILAATLVVGSPSWAQQEIPLWPDVNPANAGTGEAVTEASPNRLVVHHGPTMVAYIPEKLTTRAAVMVCPGGGYGVLAIDHEGTQVAEWLNQRGIAAFVLKYRCGGGENAHPAPLSDALRGMRLIRSMSEEYGIDPERVGVMGFSAGGHLASSTSTLWEVGNPDAKDPVDCLSSRPDFSILVYPVISMRNGTTHGGSRHNLLGDNPDEALVAKMSTDEQVNAKTPPTFLAHASDDRGVVPANSIQYFEALVKNGVRCELHMYEHGGHGFGMRTLESKQNQWLDDLDIWLKRQVGSAGE